MATCKYESDEYRCPWESDETSGDGFCILHSPNPEKNREAFAKALAAHREKHGDIFIGFVFPATFTFKNTEFSGNARFEHTTFSGDANFVRARFGGNACFEDTKFGGKSIFDHAKFSEGAQFGGAEFSSEAGFWEAEFSGDAGFQGAKFSRDAGFQGAKFSGNTGFEYTEFSGDVWFERARFLSRTLFIPGKSHQCDFTDVVIQPPDALVFRDVDLTRCRFLGTDVRKAEFVGVTWPRIVSMKWPEFIRRRWPRIASRFGVYDEDKVDKRGTYDHVEQLYRQLKQNYEDRRDYERASDFHYGEKEMRRKNPKTRPGLRFLLTLYWLISGYGERWGLPLIWMGGLIVASTLSYLRWGLLRFKDSGPVLGWTNIWETFLYSFKAMTFLKPSNFEPAGLGGDLIYTAQSVLGPLLIALSALAIRQRLKR
jgi:uncharacterized protein YjbI with pentapeptide repeats